jgi:hypothetical protein
MSTPKFYTTTDFNQITGYTPPSGGWSPWVW